MKRYPKISVVIPSYNKSKYISKTLDSIVGQNYPDLEVIIMDGGSNDGSVEIIKDYATRYPKIIKFVSEKDGGQSDAVVKGLSKVTGDIVTFINADDTYYKGAFNHVSDSFLRQPNAKWFAGRSIVVDREGKEIAKFSTFYKNFLLSMNSYNLLLTVNYLMQPSVFISKSAYDQFGPFCGNSDFITEYDLWLKIGKNQMPVVLNNNLSSFRIEPSTKTKTIYKKLIKEDYRIVREYTKNIVILFFHRLNNLARIFLVKLI